MARRPTYLKKSVKFELEKLHRKCRYCKTHQNSRGFDKHVAWCKKIWTIRNEHRDLQSFSATEVQAAQKIGSSLQVDCLPATEFVEGSSSIPMEPEADHPELGLQETNAGTTDSIDGMLISQTNFPYFYFGSFQNPLSFSALIYLTNTLKSFHIPILQIQQR